MSKNIIQKMHETNFKLSPKAIKAIETTVQQVIDLIIAGIKEQQRSEPVRKTRQSAPAPAREPEIGELAFKPMLNWEELLKVIPIGKSTLKRMMKDGRFPRGHLLSPHKRMWYADQVQQWQQAMPSKRRRGK
jgi:predicted DNA-binding transcriptional regulator AlpA